MVYDIDWIDALYPNDREEFHHPDGWFEELSPEIAVSAHENMQWLVEGWLPIGYVAVLGGEPKSGKTSLATALGFAVAGGQPFAGMACPPGAVLWCAYEENRVERHLYLRHAPAGLPFFTTYRCPWIDTRKGLMVLEHWIHKTNARLLVIDSLHGSVRGNALAENGPARRTMVGLKSLATQYACTVLCLHHLTKSQSRGVAPDRFADSVQILATSSMHLHLDVEPTETGRRVILTGTGRGPWAEQTLELESEGLLDYRLAAPRAELGTLETAILAALREKEDTSVGLAERTGYDLRHVRNTLTGMLRRGLVASPSSTVRNRTFCVG
ncbi:hypothetical protein BH11ARM2_BH11ARM2_13780 [soil metagenome]